MPEERPDASSKIDEYLATLKSRIPQVEHGALDSRLEELLNDSSANENDVIAILAREFDPFGSDQAPASFFVHKRPPG